MPLFKITWNTLDILIHCQFEKPWCTRRNRLLKFRVTYYSSNSSSISSVSSSSGGGGGSGCGSSSSSSSSREFFGIDFFLVRWRGEVKGMRNKKKKREKEEIETTLNLLPEKYFILYFYFCLGVDFFYCYNLFSGINDKTKRRITWRGVWRRRWWGGSLTHLYA